MTYNPVIGLEIHTELKTKSKMFCSCKNDPDEKRPNFNVCPICMGHPGTLPVINEEAVRKTIKTGLALNCQIPGQSKFDRKNYFYPDLPKGYQISQYDKPFCQNGYLEIDTSTGSGQAKKKIRIRRVHLEEDTGRLIHPVKSAGGGVPPKTEQFNRVNPEDENYSLVDFNRAGIPLMELVTEPDITSGKEARKFAEELQTIFRYLGVSDADMEKGEMRVEVNISLIAKDATLPMIDYRKSEEKEYIDVVETNQGKKLGILPEGRFGTKVEIKNLNSFKSVEKSVDYEIKRQAEILQKKRKIIQETRGWNDVKGTTVSQREKEEAHDYRYFPEPDLPTIYLKKEFIDGVRGEIPELPQQKRERFKREYNLDEKIIEIFVSNKDLGEYFEKVVSEFEPRLPVPQMHSLTKLAANYLITDVQGILKGDSILGEKFIITPENFAEFIGLIEKGEISSKIAKEVLSIMFKTGKDPSNIIEEKGLSQVSDETEIEKAVRETIAKNQKAVEDYKKGKETALQFLVGQVMAQTRGKAEPETVQKILKKLL